MYGDDGTQLARVPSLVDQDHYRRTGNGSVYFLIPAVKAVTAVGIVTNNGARHAIHITVQVMFECTRKIISST